MQLLVCELLVVGCGREQLLELKRLVLCESPLPHYHSSAMMMKMPTGSWIHYTGSVMMSEDAYWVLDDEDAYWIGGDAHMHTSVMMKRPIGAWIHSRCGSPPRGR